MAEWSIAVVLKTIELRGSGGSNPSLSAEYQQKFKPSKPKIYWVFCFNTIYDCKIGLKPESCGAGGAQMFKEAEKGNKEINIERTEDALETNASIIATGCPFCNTMMTDGVKNFNKEHEIQVLDVAELIANAADL